MLREILDKLELRGKEFLADRLYDVRWLSGVFGKERDKGSDEGEGEWGR